MRIIFDIQTSPGTNLSASGIYLTDLLQEMAERFVEHSFICLTEKRVLKPGSLSNDIVTHYPNKIFSKWFGKKFWYKYILPKELKKLNGDLYVTADTLLLAKATLPVCLFLFHATELLENPSLAKKQRQTKRLVADAIQRANSIITFSEKDRLLVTGQSPKPFASPKTLPLGNLAIPELKWTEKEMVKIDFAGGVEYFLFAGDLHERHDLIGLLKAFALFKKWQQSNMRLIIAGNQTTWTEIFRKEFASFKYRSEVNLMINPSKEKLQKVIAGAYALVYPASFDNFPANILKAMSASIPVISSPLPICKEWCDDTIMYPATDDATGFAGSMQQIYKDERLRSTLIDAAKKRFADIEKCDTLATCMNFFEETIAK